MNAQKYSLTINGSVDLALSGRYFKLLSSSTSIDVELLNEGTPALKAAAIDGGFYQRVPFSSVRITTPSAQQVDFLVAAEEGGSDRFTGSVTVTSGNVTVAGTVAVTSVGGVAHVHSAVTAGAASAQALAANAARKYLSIQNQSMTDDIYVRTDGGAAAATNGSIKVPTNTTWEPSVAPTGQVNMIRGATTDCGVNVIEG